MLGLRVCRLPKPLLAEGGELAGYTPGYEKCTPECETLTPVVVILVYVEIEICFLFWLILSLKYASDILKTHSKFNNDC